MTEIQQTGGRVMKLKPSVNLFFLLLLAVVATGCAGSSDSSDVIASPEGAWQSPAPSDLPINLQVGDSDVIPAVVSGDPMNTGNAGDSRLRGNDSANDDYSGKIVIKFKDGTDVRLSPFDWLRTSEGPFVSLAGVDTRELNSHVRPEIVEGRITNLRRVMSASEEDVDAWREWWRKQGATLNDWNLYYYMDVPDYEDARELVRELNNLGVADFSPRQSDSIIEYAEVLHEFRLFSIETPDFSSKQYYLDSASAGGLGVKDAWAKLDVLFPDLHLRGQNSMVVAGGGDWNFDHEMLPIDETGEYLLGPGIGEWLTWGTKQGKDIPEKIEHGTAMVGIVSAQGNGSGHGVEGIAPSTAMRVVSLSAGGMIGGEGTMLDTTGEGDLPPGSVIFTPMGPISTTGKGLPFEAKKFEHEAITDSIKTGNIVVEAAGNSGVNLDDNEQLIPEWGTPSGFNNPDKDSGAIMVGASLGADKKKASWSNCGSRIDLFAWGGGIVTSGLGDLYYAPGTDPADPDNPTKYTSQANGTSSASAEIAGIAALVQSYVRQLVFEAGYNGKVVYLDSKQMRTILKNSGQPAVYGQTPNDSNPNCNIGVQPDAAQAIDIAKEFVNNNVLKIVPLNKHVVSGIRYDMDGDKRAELISFSRDGKWYIDLSSVQPTGGSVDGYGAWDLIIPSPLGGEGQGEGSMIFPVVHDYNSDGRADLALYDSINGKWYIKYTSSSVIASPQGEAISWDRVIDYSADPAWKPYSRPVPGDYDGDRFLDTALQTPDGHWLIDYGGFTGVVIASQGEAISSVQYLDKFDAFDKDVKYLIDEQLVQAPGWAWLPIPNNGFYGMIISYRAPDGTTDAGKAFYAFETGPGIIESNYNGNDYIPIVMGYYGYDDIGEKSPDGHWQIQEDGWMGFEEPEPVGVYGDINCRPAPADYDGDKKDDRAVQCGTTWKIAYSSQPGNLSEIDLDQAIDPLPAFAYPGGIKYQDTIDLYNYYKDELGGIKESTIFDAPPPIGPYFAQCVKYWAPKASYCWDK